MKHGVKLVMRSQQRSVCHEQSVKILWCCLSDEGSPCRFEQASIDYSRMGQGIIGIQLRDKCEHDMEIGYTQKFAFPRLYPLLPLMSLTCRAMSVSTT